MPLLNKSDSNEDDSSEESSNLKNTYPMRKSMTFVLKKELVEQEKLDYEKMKLTVAQSHPRLV